eukprot:TRINITY_DN58719_c0_g1_i2.p1 TRINITY_DN58719_c0_g1~~TRINITY_DN58719_c0_g1_i2.p1  ORF type:complete len:213 (-),score=15.05 TRINITY_DN58719_c0_g1_i2:77-715(-)
MSSNSSAFTAKFKNLQLRICKCFRESPENLKGGGVQARAREKASRPFGLPIISSICLIPCTLRWYQRRVHGIRQIEDIIGKPKGRLAFSRALACTPPPFKFSGDSLKHLQILSCKFLNLAVKAEEFELILRFLEAAKEIPISENNSLLLSVRTHNSWKNFSVWHTSFQRALSIARRTLLMSDFSTHSEVESCLLYTSPSPRDLSTSRMPSSA